MNSSTNHTYGQNKLFFMFFYSPNLSHLLMSAPVIPPGFPTYGYGRAIRWVCSELLPSSGVVNGLVLDRRNHVPTSYTIREYGSASSLNTLREKGSCFSPQPQFPGSFWKSFLGEGLLRTQMLVLEAGIEDVHVGDILEKERKSSHPSTENQQH